VNIINTGGGLHEVQGALAAIGLVSDTDIGLVLGGSWSFRASIKPIINGLAL